MPVSVRAATAVDTDFLLEMLVEAAGWRPEAPRLTGRELLSQPDLAHYIVGWPRNGDNGVVAHEDEPLGAAWYRLLPADDPGYGFVDAKIPEVSIGVVPHRRGEGIGRLLLTSLLYVARETEQHALSLSVEEDNPAVRLYEAVGFRIVGRLDNAWTMLVELR